MLLLILDPKKHMIVRTDPSIFNWGLLALGGDNTGNLFSF